MRRIKLSKTALNGVKNAKIVKPFETPYYKKLVEQADKRIQENKKEQARVYIRSKNYIAK